ncbi:MAG: PadR family transcriptional regulator [Anaerolineae bacterium]|nr:PadR family transcriptional regulator [Anaerolineae bacterium]
MSTRLVILGFLRYQPMHGYELKQLIERYMGDWTSVAFGSIYFALRKLEEDGFIEKLGTEQEGNRPSRSVYQITGTGCAEFLRLLRAVWCAVERQYYDFDIGLFFMDALPGEDVKGYLRERVERLETHLRHVNRHRAEELADETIPLVAATIFEHTLRHLEAELAWTRDVLEKVEAGAYT